MWATIRFRDMYELTVETDFAAAHMLRGYPGACERLHGHNWRVEVVVGGERLNDLGLLMDFRDLKRVVSGAVRRLDHTLLNDLEEFKEQNPSTENIARMIYEECLRRMPEGVTVRSVTVWESPRCGARYSPGT